MKLCLSTEELLSILDQQGLTPAIKEKIAGVILSVCNTNYIRSVVAKAVEKQVNTAIDDAFNTPSWQRNSEGWAIRALKNHVVDSAQKLNLEDLVRRIVEEEVGGRIRDIARELITEDLVRSARRAVESYDICALVHTEVKQSLGRIVQDIADGKPAS